MCIFMNEEEDVYDNMDPITNNNNTISSPTRTGARRWHFHTHHKWIIPKKPLLLVFTMCVFCLIMGILLMAIGGAIDSVGMKVVGGLLFGFSIVGLIVCLLVGVFTFFYYGMRDQATQTTENPMDDLTQDIPGYTTTGRPSALKSPDSTLKRNGTLGVKKVTMAPELGPYGPLQPISTANNNHVSQSPATNTSAPSNQPLHRLPSPGMANRLNTLPRSGYIDGNTVGTGGIRITPKNVDQPFPSPASSVSYGGSSSAGQYYTAGGGGSLNSNSTDTYAYPRSVLGYDTNSNTSGGSQYSTLRTIPVTHIRAGTDSGRNTLPTQEVPLKEVEYATVNKSGNKVGGTLVRVEHLPPSNAVSSVQKFVQNPDDDRYKDYDNPVERVPMIASAYQHQHLQQSQQQPQNSNLSYHERQMQYQRQGHRAHQQDLHAPRQINPYSLQKQYSPNPYVLSPQQRQEQQMHQYKTAYELEKKQQQQYQSQLSKMSSAASSARNSMVDDVFEPQPLVYPSARRPMTFEQVSSSKMSVYDNMGVGDLRINDEIAE